MRIMNWPINVIRNEEFTAWVDPDAVETMLPVSAGQTRGLNAGYPSVAVRREVLKKHVDLYPLLAAINCGVNHRQERLNH